VLLDEAAVLAAMAYVDLNPVRAKICDSLEESHHTSAKQRIAAIADNPSASDRALAPIIGLLGFGVLSISQEDYLALVDFTGRQIRPDKRGAIMVHPRRRCDGWDTARTNGLDRSWPWVRRSTAQWVKSRVWSRRQSRSDSSGCGVFRLRGRWHQDVPA
jgi:hypothetical protein